MKFNKTIFTLLVCAAMMMSTRSASAANTKVDLIQDVAPGGVGAIDMAGDTGFGFINFNQNANGDLRVTISLKNASPNTEYNGVFLVCGPTHATACGFVDVGDMTTNNQGNANATMMLSTSFLNDEFGSGAKTDHFDLIGNGSGDVYVASGIDYIVP
jgi:hypothetical protein